MSVAEVYNVSQIVTRKQISGHQIFPLILSQKLTSTSSPTRPETFKMRSNSLNVAMLSLLSVLGANALPAGEALEKRASPGIYLCENARFQGYCHHFTTPWGVCSKFSQLAVLLLFYKAISGEETKPDL